MGMFLRAKYPCICSEAGTARHRMGRQHAARVQVLEEAVSRGGAKTFEPNQIIVGMNSYASWILNPKPETLNPKL